jgi:type IV pilus assembly protein PilW
MKQRVSRSRMQGMSLIELMVSLVIGLVVVGAVLVSYLGAGRTGKLQVAYAEMNENAQVAMSTLTRELLQAGYASPTGVNGSATFVRSYSARPVMGCDNGFVSPNTTSDVACAVGTGGPAIEVVYEADTTNTVPTSAGVPSDCLGNGLPATPIGTATFYFSYNRYYLATSAVGRPELHCASRQGAAGQPLVDNVEALKIWYGEANAANPRQVVRYVSAANVTDWGMVISVRTCMLMRSSEPVLEAEDPLNYLDCDSASQTSADRFARRAYFTTTTLRNKMAF